MPGEPHFYGHLEEREREVFLTEARRVAPELVVVDAAVRPDRERAEWQERVLNDGSRFTIYKRHFEGHELAEELGTGTVVHESRWFVVVTSSRGAGEASRQSSSPGCSPAKPRQPPSAR